MQRASAWKFAAALALLSAPLFCAPEARAVVTVFFDRSQTTNMVGSGATSDTVSTEGYLFTVTRDKLFTGGIGLTNPIGRYIRVPWPDGMEAQAVTAGPVLSGARIDIKREDGELFAIESFTAQLLANTAGAGAAFEIMPMLNGEDGVPDPFMYDATGYAGMNFTYATPELTGFDAYKMTLYVDFALMNLAVVDTSPPRPTLEISLVSATSIQISWPTNSVGYRLEFSTNLPTVVWSTVTNISVTNGEFCTVQLPASASQRFYRLEK